MVPGRMDEELHGWMDMWMSKLAYRSVRRWIDGWMDKWVRPPNSEEYVN